MSLNVRDENKILKYKKLKLNNIPNNIFVYEVFIFDKKDNNLYLKEISKDRRLRDIIPILSGIHTIKSCEVLEFNFTSIELDSFSLPSKYEKPFIPNPTTTLITVN